MPLGIMFQWLAVLSDWGFSIIYFLLLVRIIMSWFISDARNQFFATVYQLTEPVLSIFRKLPLQIGPVDLSPMLAFFSIYLLQIMLVSFFLRLSVVFG